jgi:branched-chain amino acid transport system permease protein
VPFLVALLVDGALAGALYALLGLAFVVVYKASRMINFALGEATMLGGGLVAAGLHVLGLGLGAALGVAGAAMITLALVFNRVVLRRLLGRPLLASIMVTLGLGAFLRGATTLTLGGVPRRITLPVSSEPLDISGLFIPTDKIVAAAIATLAIVVIAGLFRWTRTGLALRAIADDQQVATAMGIDLPRHLALTWATAGVLAVLAGTLWTVVAGGGLGLVVVGLKVFPIVVIGGLDSIPGTIVAAVLVGVVESVTAGFVDPLLGAGFSTVVLYVALIVMLVARPYGLFGRADVARV